MFDNANINVAGPNQTLGLDFYLDLTNKKATILRTLADPNEPLYAPSQGAYDPLPNGNIFMGYGQLPIFKEYGPNGNVRMTTQWADLASDESSYRTYRLDWTAQPAASPIVVTVDGSAFMSWNGATDVKGWQIYEGLTAGELKLTQTVASTGFETEVSLSNSTNFVQVGALCANSNEDGVVRKSGVIQVS